MDFDLETTWKDLEDVMLNEVSQTHEGKHCMISLDVKSKTAKPREAEHRPETWRWGKAKTRA